jgi:hypothetical protein
MKKSYFLVLFVLLFATTISVAQVTVKFQKPDSWTAVSLYTWDAELLGGWPGATLTETDGWYTYTFDASFTGANLIFNNGGAGEQAVDYRATADVCLKAADVLNAGGKYDVSVVPCTAPGITVKFKKPANWTDVRLYTWGPEATGGWPGAALTETNGWYTYTFDVSFTGANLIFNNGATEQTEDYAITADVCLQAASVLNANSKYDVTVADCNPPVGMTVKFKKPESWTAVSLYTWGPEATGGWPGATLTETDGWYTYTFEPSFTGANLIFNNAGAGEQAEDYAITADVCLQASSTLNANSKYDVAVVPCIAPGFTVKFQKPESWTAVGLYTWGPEALGGWPGAILTETDGWYSYTFDAAFTGANLIFNNAGAGEQAEDYAITADACLKASSVLNANSKYDVTVVDCATITSISTVKEKSLTIYPNPVAEKLNFSSSSTIDRVAIYSITGKNIMNVTENLNKGIVDVKSLKPGVYFVSIYFANGNQQFEKIIKR